MDKFNFNRDFYEGCRALGDREGMALAWAMLRYGYEGVEPKLKPATMAAFSFARGRIDAMVSGSMGGRARAAKSFSFCWLPCWVAKGLPNRVANRRRRRRRRR